MPRLGDAAHAPEPTGDGLADLHPQAMRTLRDNIGRYSNQVGSDETQYHRAIALHMRERVLLTKSYGDYVYVSSGNERDNDGFMHILYTPDYARSTQNLAEIFPPQAISLVVSDCTLYELWKDRARVSLIRQHPALETERDLGPFGASKHLLCRCVEIVRKDRKDWLG